MSKKKHKGLKKGELVVCNIGHYDEFTKGKVYTIREDQIDDRVRVALDDKGSGSNGWHESHFERLTIHNAPPCPTYAHSPGYQQGCPGGIINVTTAEMQAAFNQINPAPTVLGTQVGGSHYTDCAIQPIEYIWANNLGFSEGNIIKYVTRWKTKGGIKDLEKAKHHIALLIEHETTKGTK